jgi:MFS transporter, DHA1 family, multidrug resistance protein
MRGTRTKGAYRPLKRPHLQPWQSNLWAIVVAEVMALVSFQASFILIPYYIQELGISDVAQVAAWTGAYQSLGAIGFTVATPIWGALGDRYGRKPMLVRAMFATALALAGIGIVRTPTQLMVLRVVQGCFTGTPAAASTLVATGSPKDRLAYALGMVQTSVFVGSTLGPMMGGYIADAYGYRATFFAGGAVVLVATLLVVLMVREPIESAAIAARARTENPVAGFRSILGSPGLLALIAMVFSVGLTYGLLGPALPLFIQQLVGTQDHLASIAGTITGVGAFTAAVSALAIGRVSDRIGHRRALLACSVGMSALYFPHALVRSASALGVVRGLQGFFQGGISPSLSAMVVNLSPKDKTGAALGLTSSASSAGFAIGPVLGALILAATPTTTVFYVAGIAFALVTIVNFAVGTRASEPSGAVESAPAAHGVARPAPQRDRA